MPTKEEKNRRKALLREIVRREHVQAEARIPISKSDLKALFNYVSDKVEEQGCNNTLQHTRAFLFSHQLPQEPIIQWLAEYGGYCDCEVIANVEEAWEEIKV